MQTSSRDDRFRLRHLACKCVTCEKKERAEVILQNFCGHSHDRNIFALRKLLRRSKNYFSSSGFFSFFFAHSSASAGAGLRSMIAGHFAESSRLSAMNGFCASGTSSSAKIASTGHSGTHRVQSMHSSGSITSMFGPSRKQSTGQTSTQSVYLHLMQLSVTTYAISCSNRINSLAL